MLIEIIHGKQNDNNNKWRLTMSHLHQKKKTKLLLFGKRQARKKNGRDQFGRCMLVIRSVDHTYTHTHTLQMIKQREEELEEEDKRHFLDISLVLSYFINNDLSKYFNVIKCTTSIIHLTCLVMRNSSNSIFSSSSLLWYYDSHIRYSILIDQWSAYPLDLFFTHQISLNTLE